ncbi:MAG TPA: DUF1360 domain-containing protein [Bryobacteraceae bacterium]|jgi:hypothetical protein|nr:DUF1360 domain-containing protein [Bryobacteraceae bacterium]
MNATVSLPWTAFLAAVLAVWRVTHLLWGEDGPFDLFVRLRKFAGAGFFGRLLDCFYCLSLWIAAPLAVALASSWLARIVLWFGLSGGAILLERFSRPSPPPARWSEEPLKEEHEKEA